MNPPESYPRQQGLKLRVLSGLEPPQSTAGVLSKTTRIETYSHFSFLIPGSARRSPIQDNAIIPGTQYQYWAGKGDITDIGGSGRKWYLAGMPRKVSGVRNRSFRISSVNNDSCHLCLSATFACPAGSSQDHRIGDGPARPGTPETATSRWPSDAASLPAFSGEKNMPTRCCAT